MHLPLPDNIMLLAADVRLLALDVDGVLTDGRLYFSAQGDELKAFNILDGQGIKMLHRSGIDVALITGRSSPLTARRARDLGIERLMQGRADKAAALRELCGDLNIPLQQTAYMGDDLPDLEAILIAGLGITVPNGHWHVREQAPWCTQVEGGAGAVREVCDLILQARGLLADLHAGYRGSEREDEA